MRERLDLDRAQGRRSSSDTPSMVMMEPPAPSMWAPMSQSMFAKSTISGSRAALAMTVWPFATTAAMSVFSVAPTLGKSK